MIKKPFKPPGSKTEGGTPSPALVKPYVKPAPSFVLQPKKPTPIAPPAEEMIPEEKQKVEGSSTPTTEEQAKISPAIIPK